MVGDQSLSPWPRGSTVSAYHPDAARSGAVAPQEWRVCPPPCSSTTGGAAGSPNASAVSVTSPAVILSSDPAENRSSMRLTSPAQI